MAVEIMCIGCFGLGGHAVDGQNHMIFIHLDQTIEGAIAPCQTCGGTGEVEAF